MPVSWTIGGIPLPSAVVFVALHRRRVDTTPDAARERVAVTSGAYEGRGDAWDTSGSLSTDRAEALDAYRASGVLVLATTSDGSVSTFYARVERVSARVNDTATTADLTVVVHVAATASADIQGLTTLNATFVEHDF